MSEASQMSGQASFWGLPNATSLPVEGSGASRCATQDGPTTDQSGQEAAPAPLSRQQAKAAGLMTLVTSGLIGSNSSGSAALQSSLESRLMTRLDTAGSTLFKLTWKRRRTPLGRWYLERAASVRRTSASGFTSWQTPKKPSGGGQEIRSSTGGGIRKIEDQAMLSSWGTPAARDWKDGSEVVNVPLNALLGRQAWMASWGTPRANDAEKRGQVADDPRNGMVTQANLAHWVTPTTPSGGQKVPDGTTTGGKRPNGTKATVTLDMLAQSTAFGETPNGFPAEFLKYPEQLSGGLLNGAHSLWLQGIPSVWRSFVSQAMQSMSKSRKRLSKRT